MVRTREPGKGVQKTTEGCNPFTAQSTKQCQRKKMGGEEIESENERSAKVNLLSKTICP